MIAVVQRVLQAAVIVDNQTVGHINHGMLVLAAVEKDDTPADLEWTANKLLGLRIFRNADKHFDLDITQTGGGILLVSNFTVAAETKKGRRPSLEPAATPETGRELFTHFVTHVRNLAPATTPIQTGQFGADMKVTLTNDGPVTFIIKSR